MPIFAKTAATHHGGELWEQPSRLRHSTTGGIDIHHGFGFCPETLGNIPCQPAGNPYPYSSTSGSAQPNASGLLIFLGLPDREYRTFFGDHHCWRLSGHAAGIVALLVPFFSSELLSVLNHSSGRLLQVHTTTPNQAHLASNMAGNNPNRRSLDLFNVDQQAVENLDLTFQETLPSSTSTVSYLSSRVLLHDTLPKS